jgi:hypothetical protein
MKQFPLDKPDARVKGMRFRRSNSILLGLLLLFIASRSENRAQNAEKKSTSSRTVIFAVTQGDGIKIDPIVIIDRGRYLQPPGGVDEEAGHFQDTPESSQFAAKYYRPGQTYQLLFGGGKVGSATVTNRTSRACISLAASVRLQTSQKIGGWVMALATDANSLGLHESSRHAPSVNERSAVLELAKRTYGQRGVPASLLTSIKVTNLTAVDPDHDGNPELVGSFRIEQDQKAHLLFLIVGKHGGNYKIELQRYDEGLEDGEDFVDELDVDGDGLGEVITQVSAYESWEYAIYKRKGGRWQVIYKGGGGGC